jgi:hypothetical protein
MSKSIPIFRYQLSNSYGNDFLWITDGAIKIYKITDVIGFYALFGYKEEMRKESIEPDFFIWENYIKNSALKDNLCLQAIIIKFLIENSAKFREEYADAYLNWLGTCYSEKMNSIDDCINCKMHSSNKQTEKSN